MLRPRTSSAHAFCLMLLLLCIGFCTSCSKKTTKGITQAEMANTTFSKELTLSYQVQSCVTDDNDLSIDLICLTLDSIIEDSRCPIGVNCIWEGNAKLRFRMTTRSNAYQFDLDTQPNATAFKNDTLIGGYRIKMVDVAPYPTSEYEIQDSNVTAKLVISSKEYTE